MGGLVREQVQSCKIRHPTCQGLEVPQDFRPGCKKDQKGQQNKDEIDDQQLSEYEGQSIIVIEKCMSRYGKYVSRKQQNIGNYERLDLHSNDRVGHYEWKHDEGIELQYVFLTFLLGPEDEKGGEESRVQKALRQENTIEEQIQYRDQ